MELDTSKLQVGDVIKNYKVLCELLNVPTVGGTQKKSQLKEFDRYFEYEKVGQKFLITELYANPLNKKDKRIDSISHRAIYVEDIEVLMLQFLSMQSQDTAVYMTNKQLWLMLRMVNYNYYIYEKDGCLHDTQALDDIPEKEINDFYSRIRNKFNKILTDALQSLDRRKLITYERTKVIYDTRIHDIREATNDEKNIIRDIQYGVLESMGYISEQQVKLLGVSEEYYKRCNSKLSDKLPYASYTYTTNKLLYTKNTIVKELTKLELLGYQKHLNQNVITAANNQATNLFNKSKEEQDRILIGSTDRVYAYPFHYLEHQYLLADTLLKI